MSSIFILQNTLQCEPPLGDGKSIQLQRLYVRHERMNIANGD